MSPRIGSLSACSVLQPVFVFPSSRPTVYSLLSGKNVDSAVARVRRILKEAALGHPIHFEKCLEGGILTGSLELVIKMDAVGLEITKGSARAQFIDRIRGKQRWWYTYHGGAFGICYLWSLS